MAGQGTFTIDSDKVAGTFLWDTSALVRAFDPQCSEADAPLARAVSDAMLRRRDTRILVAAVSLAEYIIKPDRVLPRVRPIIVVPFDEAAARVCAERVPQTIPEGDPRPAAYWKRDALIIATALARNVHGFVSADGKQLKRAAEVGLKAMQLSDFLAEPAPQIGLFDLIG